MADKPIDIGIVFFPGMTQLDVSKRKPTPTFRRGFELSRVRAVVGEALRDGWERGLL